MIDRTSRPEEPGNNNQQSIQENNSRKNLGLSIRLVIGDYYVVSGSRLHGRNDCVGFVVPKYWHDVVVQHFVIWMWTALLPVLGCWDCPENSLQFYGWKFCTALYLRGFWVL